MNKIKRIFKNILLKNFKKSRYKFLAFDLCYLNIISSSKKKKKILS